MYMWLAICSRQLDLYYIASTLEYRVHHVHVHVSCTVSCIKMARVDNEGKCINAYMMHVVTPG